MPPVAPHDPPGFKRRAGFVLSLTALLGFLLIAAEPVSKKANLSQGLQIWVNDLLLPCGQCLLSAAIIGAAVDRYARTRFVQEVTRESLGYIVGYGLPRSLQAKIQEVVSQRVIRRNLRVRFVLTDAGTTPRQILLKEFLEFEMANFSNVPQMFQPVCELERRENPYLIHVACDSPPEYEFYDAAPQSEVKNNIFKLLPRTTNIPCLRPNEGPYLFRLAYGLGTPKPVDSFYTFSFWIVTDRVHIEVEAPDDLDISVRPEWAVRHGNVWTLDEAFLVEQHFQILWRPKP